MESERRMDNQQGGTEVSTNEEWTLGGYEAHGDIEREEELIRDDLKERRKLLDKKRRANIDAAIMARAAHLTKEEPK